MAMAVRVLLLLSALAQQPAPIVGFVVDSTGLPLAGAVITVKGAVDVAVTDDRGRFAITAAGPAAVLVAAMPGFVTRDVPLKPGATRDVLRIALDVAGISDQVTVRAPAVSTPPDARLTLRPLDVVRTAGAQADLMRALAVLPGVVQVDEGAGLFVRGGDVSETTVLLDGVVVNHPYRYETPTGGFRGAVDPFLTQGAAFATGGFSADFGNTLGGIVDLHGLARPTVPRITGTAGLAGVSFAAAEPIGDKGGLRIAANRTTPQVLFAVNPSPRAFDRLPGGWDLSGSAHFDSATHGRFRVFATEQRDHVGVSLEKDAFVGFLHSGVRHGLVAASWQLSLRNGWTVTAAGGRDRYLNATDVGVFAISETDTETSARVDAGGRANGWTLRFGGTAQTSRTDADGRVPSVGDDFGGVQGTSVFTIAHRDWQAGGYGEATRTFGRLTPAVGLRVDRFGNAGVARVDPRLNLTIAMGSFGRLRFAGGIYHQAPSSKYFDQIRGSRRLLPMAAAHYIAGYELGAIEGAAFLRLEAYVKTYTNLPVQDEALGFADTGYGHARGIDLFARRVWHFIDIRASASWLQAARRWTSPEQFDRYPLPAGTWTPDFAIPYTGQLVVNLPVTRTVAFGLGWRTAAGRPFTPIAGSVQTPDGYAPLWATINSDRLPRYQRVDLSLSWTRAIGSRGLAVFFASVDNVSNRQNFFEYAYSADYSQRHPVAGASPRSVYVGCSITR